MGQAVYADYHIGTLFAVLYMYPNCIVLTSLLLWGKGYAIHTHHIPRVRVESIPLNESSVERVASRRSCAS